MDGNDTYLTPEQVEEDYHFPTRTQERRRSDGSGPRYVRLGRRILYRRSDIEAWLAARTFKSHADERARELEAAEK